MKLNKIISSLLVFVMLFTGLFTVLPVGSLAAAATAVVSVEEATEDPKAILEAFGKYNFSTTEQMLDFELEQGYLDSLTKGDYKLYLNRYTGVVYYVNSVTGQILTSNPFDLGYRNNIGTFLLSQVDIKFMDLALNQEKSYSSAEWISEGSKMTVSEMEDGIRVLYELGEQSKFLTPASIMADDFDAHIATPLFDAFISLIDQYCNNVNFDKNKSDLRKTDGNGKEFFDLNKVTSYVTEVLRAVRSELGENSVGYKAIFDLGDAIKTVFSNYSVVDITKYNTATESGKSKIEELKKRVPGCVNGPVYQIVSVESTATFRICHRAIKKYCPDYTLEKVAEDENKAGFLSELPTTPYFEIVVEYKIDDDGNFEVTVPMSGVYCDPAYTITEINVLKYFGAGDMNYDGYIFLPDGSGAIVEFDDFYTPEAIKGENVTNNQIYLKSPMYGKDYCYAEITGQHREQIIMPVYGLVNSVKANASTEAIVGSERITNGFFAIIEDGSALANLMISTGGATNKYATTYASFSPYPMDKYKVTGSAGGYYYVVSQSPYAGSFVTQYTMLSDDTTAAAAGLAANEYFTASYVGMAECYRNYLKQNGTIEAISEVSEDLPLYIEALGSIDILQRILSFPITVSVPLTTFDDVYTMYEELSKAKDTLKAKANEYRALANAAKEDEVDLKAQYLAKAEKYDELSANVQNITNINFKLTGFANGGMYFTYPTRVNWENSVGGKNGFEALINKAKTDSFGVYPDFDFAYINNTAIFDGISSKGTAACMVDNRYASKQVYNSVAGKYESIFALVVSPDSYERLYNSFNSQYSQYKWNNLSVSTLGSDLNSNFYKDKALDREGALDSVTSTLDKMANVSNYKLMMDVGNVYAVKYAEHILNATLDSSHFRYSSYAIPFYGLVFHGYVNYAGSPINYSGDPDYEILRAIENGASLYYVLCMQNTNYLKDDEQLSKYYGVDYKNWFDKLVVQYATLNKEIGDLQKHEIVDHMSILSERVIDSIEKGHNYENLINELVGVIDKAIFDAINAKQDEMSGDVANIGKGVKLLVDKAGIIAYATDAIQLDSAELVADFTAALDEIVAKYATEFSGQGYTNPEVVNVGAADISYKSRYKYFTDSTSTSGDDYVRTDFTCDNGNVVMVKYRDPVSSDEVVFLLNYNAFAVDIVIDSTLKPSLEAGVTEKITLKACGYFRIGGEG